MEVLDTKAAWKNTHAFLLFDRQPTKNRYIYVALYASYNNSNYTAAEMLGDSKDWNKKKILSTSKGKVSKHAI